MSDFVWQVPDDAVATPTPWSAVRLAIRQWIVTSSGLPGARVVWFGQNHRIPDGTYIVLRLSMISEIGMDWSTITEAVDTTLTEHVAGPRAAQLTITCYSGVGATDATGCVLLLDGVLAARALESIQNILQAANVGIGVIQPAQALGAAINTAQFEPRAETSVTLHLVSEITGAAYVIETWDVDGDIDVVFT